MKRIFLIVLLLCSLQIFAQYPDWKYFGKSSYVFSFAEEGNFMWIGNSQGLVKMNKITGAKIYYNNANSPLPNNSIREIVIDNKGVKWILTVAGIARLEGTNWSIYTPSNSAFPVQYVNDIETDASNNLWIGGNSKDGLIKYNGVNWTSINTSNSGIPDNSIGAILVDGTTIWVSTNNGLGKFDGVNWTVYNVSNSTISSDYQVHKMAKDKNGNVWLLRSGGLEKFDGTAFTLFDQSTTSIPNESLTSMTVDTDNTIWVGCSSYGGGSSNTVIGGIMSFNGTTWTKYDTTNSPISDTEIYTVYTDQSNHIWMGGKNGWVDLKKDATWASCMISNVTLHDNNVIKMVFDQYGAAYIGTRKNQSMNNKSQGVIKYDWNNSTLVKDFVDDSWGITTDKFGNLYTKTKLGLNKFDGINWTTIPNTPPLKHKYYPTMYYTGIATDMLGGVWINYLDSVYMAYDPVTATFSQREEEGIAHYDGVNWVRYNKLNAPISAGAYAIKVDHQNNLWVSTTGKGLLKFDGKKWTSYTTSNSSLPMNMIPCFTIDPEGNVWFSNLNNELVKFDGSTCTTFVHPLGSSVVDIETDIDGSIWLASLAELIRFDGTNWTTFGEANSPLSYLGNPTSLSIDKYGNKWLGTTNGVFVYKQGGVILVAVPAINESPVSISAFPNPFENGFEIQLNGPMNNLEITLYDGLGRQVFNKAQKQTQILEIPRNGLKPGIYFYQVKSNDKVFNGKVIAE